MAARPMPVLPEVGSMMVAPGASLPSRSAACSIHRAALSLTLPVGFRYSSLHSSRAESPRACPKRAASSRGVPPTSPVMSFTICSIAVPPFFGRDARFCFAVGLTIKEGAAGCQGESAPAGCGPSPKPGGGNPRKPPPKVEFPIANTGHLRYNETEY